MDFLKKLTASVGALAQLATSQVTKHEATRRTTNDEANEANETNETNEVRRDELSRGV